MIQLHFENRAVCNFITRDAKKTFVITFQHNKRSGDKPQQVAGNQISAPMPLSSNSIQAHDSVQSPVQVQAQVLEVPQVTLNDIFSVLVTFRQVIVQLDNRVDQLVKRIDALEK